MRDTLFQLSRQYLEAKNQPYKRDILSQQQTLHRLLILIGQRGVGKTTFIIQKLLEHAKGDLLSTQILYVPTDHFLISDYSLYSIAEDFSKYGGKYIAFDEIHKYPNWSQELKSIYDTFPELQIIASGSSALEIHKGSHDLARRSTVTEIVGLSFREYIELSLNMKFNSIQLSDILANHESISQNIIQKLSRSHKKILALFEDYLKTGYYPYFLELASKELYSITLEQNIHAALESDLPAIYPFLNGNSTKKIKKLLSFIAANVPFTTNIAKLKEFTEVSDQRTIKNYLYYLEQARIICSLCNASNKLKKYEVPAKIYLNNTNQLYALNPSMTNLGTIRETFFSTMLLEKHSVTIPRQGDFLINQHYTFEVGGKSKSFSQIKNIDNAYIAADNIEMGFEKKIPLWLFGFIY